MKLGRPTRQAFGEAILELGRKNPDIVVLDADLSKSIYTVDFAKEFPERHFEMGIAEANMMSTAAGLATCGKIPFACTFACFVANRALDQLRISIAYPHLNVKLVGSHGGLTVGEDGASHQATEDIAVISALPGFVVLVPADEVAAREAVKAAAKHKGPVYLRLGRPRVPIVYENGCDFQLGSANLLRRGDDLTIIACGVMLSQALTAASVLAEEGIEARVLDMHTVKPLDEEAVLSAAKETGAIVTAEEHLAQGGLGSAIARLLAENHPVPMRLVAIQDTYAESGKPGELLEKYGLSPKHIVAAAKEALALKVEGHAISQ